MFFEMRWRLALILVVVVAAVAAFNYFRPIPAIAASASFPPQTTTSGTPPALPWPAGGSAAVGVKGLGFIASSGNEQPIPAASVTKVMTALLILEDKPLQKDQQGPTITITDADVANYEADVANKESVVAVRAGEQITQLEALQGMLIPPANTLAETPARWEAGSIDAFVVKMNSRAAALHLTHTKFSDTSGA